MDGLRSRHLPRLRRENPRIRRVEAEESPGVHGGPGVRLPSSRVESSMTGRPSLAIDLGGLKLRNPFLAASGTCGYGVEIAGAVDLSTLGGIVTKGLYMSPRDGCEVPRIAETPSGLLNAIGLQGVGIRAFVADVMPELRKLDTAVVVNVCGETVEEYAEVSKIASDCEGVHALEINISCPNVKTGGIAFGSDPVTTHHVISAIRAVTKLPLIPKLSPNV